MSSEVAAVEGGGRAGNPRNNGGGNNKGNNDRSHGNSRRGIRVVVADDHPAFRQAVDAVLGLEPDIDVIAQAANADEAARRVETLRPDVVLMDIRMPGGGIEATRRVHELAPEVKVLILTVSDEESDLYEAIKAGANGYLLKEIALEDVAHAVRALRRGESLITPSMASKLLNEFSTLARQAEPVTRPSQAAPTLTARESEVLRLLAAGLSNREIAEDLIIAENTVKNHVRNILDKLHLRSRTQAATWAYQARLVTPRDDS